MTRAKTQPTYHLEILEPDSRVIQRVSDGLKSEEVAFLSDEAITEQLLERWGERAASLSIWSTVTLVRHRGSNIEKVATYRLGETQWHKEHHSTNASDWNGF